ncbi:MAG: hypothetical protein IKP03_07825 [Fibrobacter sp.]|nr:hypothetical protein [Fibrobacter sp.]
MVKKFLMAGIAACLFAACDESTSSQAPEQEEVVAVESSSGDDSIVSSSGTESSSSENVAGSSATDPAASSSSQEAQTSSASQEQATSSATAAPESSSSESSKVPRYDKLPFDTTGVKPDVYDFVPVDTGAKQETYKYEPIDESYYASYGENAKRVYPRDYEGYCYIVDEPNGEYGGGFMSTSAYLERVVIVQDDSLLYADLYECSDYVWDGCRNSKDAYLAKIKVGEDIFYYREFEDELKLVQLTDSTVSEWTVKNPSYVAPVVESHSGWPKSMFADDALVTFVGDDPNSDYADTLYIEKYNVKITDGENTWIFENDTCTERGYSPASDLSASESCSGYIKYHNESKACIKRNLGTASFVRLCRPQKDVYASWKVWCILDQEKPD